MLHALIFIVLYVVSGKLSLLLAQPPGYASAIFPPAGIAIAVALMMGRRSLPWIFLGSLLLNLWIGYDAAQTINTVGLASAILIAIASTLQAAAGGALLRKFVGFPPAFNQGRDILVFLILAPFITLISATLSIASLYLLGVLPLASVGNNWLSWWAGDTSGLVVMLPIVLVAIGRPRELWRSRIPTVAIPMLVAFVLVTMGYLIANRWEQSESLTEFKLLSNRTFDEMRLRLELQDSLLEQIHELFAKDSATPITRKEFGTFLEHALNRFTAIQAIEWAPRIAQEQRQTFESTQRRDIPGFAICERDPQGNMHAAAERPIYQPVTYVEPLRHNEAAMGFDLASNPERLAAITQAINTGKLVATSPIRLVQENQNQSGVLLIRAVEVGSRKDDVVLIVLRMGNFMSQASSATANQLQARLIDVAADKVLYDTFEETAKQTPAIWHSSLTFGLREYRLETSPSAAYLASHHGWQSWLVLLVGLISTGLLGALLMLGTGQKAHAETLVHERTQALRDSQEMLANAQRIAHIGSWEWHIENGQMIWSDETFLILGVNNKETPASLETLLQRIHPEDVDQFKAALEDASQRKQNIELENRILLPSGRQRFVAHRIEFEKKNMTHPQRLVGVIRDITASKEIDAMKSEFVSVVSHELRPPLTSIRGALGLICGGAVDANSEQAKNVLEIAHKNAERLGTLINDLLDMEKLVSGKMKFDMQAQAIMPLVEQSIESTRGYGQQYGVTFQIKSRANGTQILADASRLQQVLANLLSNAAKFSPRNGEVEINVDVRDGIVRVAVTDHGPGIPEPFKDKIFQKFSQADASDSRQKGGTGLGLAISKEIIERMNGVIDFESVAGQGSTFYIELPTLHSA